MSQIRSRKVSEVFICSRHSIDNQIILFWNLKAAGIHLRIVPTELPQSIDVLQGQMSLVGPRPLPIGDYERSMQNTEQFAQNRLLRYEVLLALLDCGKLKDVQMLALMIFFIGTWFISSNGCSL